MEDRVILVDIFDNQIGSGEKMRVHREGRLHRAFSVFLYDGRKMLIQQRNPEKYHVFLGKYRGEVQANPDEISEVRWVELDELSRDLQMHPEKYCAWFLIAAPKVIKKIQEEWEDK